jgi:3-hydroxyacyl-CoA dehydrogenase / enoyl-CoA hydratase / 3-hydroxybutyryl-CoA epimerase / enoyl-CoA isomerase
MKVESFARLQEMEDGLYEVLLDAPDARVNVLSKTAVASLIDVIGQLPLDKVRGLLLRSAKDGFVAGADITEFCESFAKTEDEILAYSQSVYDLLNRIEDLPFPTVCAINGEALGGGFELALACDLRVAADSARVGLPEVNLGIMPGWGGSVRLPRVSGLDNAMTWMTQGRPFKAADALRVRAVDAVVAADYLLTAALQMLRDAVAGKLDYRQHRQCKLQPMPLPEIELAMACDTAEGMVSMMVSEHYPAARTIVRSVRASAVMSREQAQQQEARDFIRLARSSVARNLVGLFLADQGLKRKNRNVSRDSAPVAQAAVLGAGIMGGGVAYQSASTGTPILMKDIAQPALDAGIAEATRLLDGQIKRGKLKPGMALEISRRIQTRLDYQGFEAADLVVEAVVEKVAVKQAVLKEVEAVTRPGTVLATNTSTLTVDELAVGLERPQDFCGMHFFNPVHRMPLVEIIRGKATSDEAVAKAVTFALNMKKVPVVVRDCPGFLVNRILLPYIHAFTSLVVEGVDFTFIDKCMESFGWPMGPATLMDIVGMDTGCHAAAIMGKAYPDRMDDSVRNATHVLFEAGRLGQKTGAGYYRYELDKKGKPKKVKDPAVQALIAPIVTGNGGLSEEVVVHRMMIPLCLEAVRCLEEGIADSAADIDLALVNGIGYPTYIGGALAYIDTIGVKTFVWMCDQYSTLGEAYRPTARLREMAASNQTFYSL